MDENERIRSIGCDECISFATYCPNGFVVIIAGAGAGGGIAARVETISDIEGDGFTDGFGLTACQAPIAVLFDDEGLYDEGFEGVAEAGGTPDGDIVVGAIGVSTGCGDDHSVVIGEYSLFGYAPGAG